MVDDEQPVLDTPKVILLDALGHCLMFFFQPLLEFGFFEELRIGFYPCPNSLSNEKRLVDEYL
jgi:hypothetical protein